jgi:hypothetical protein
MRVEFDLKATAAGKKPRLLAWGKERGGSYGGRWFALDASGRLPIGFEPSGRAPGDLVALMAAVETNLGSRAFARPRALRTMPSPIRVKGR